MECVKIPTWNPFDTFVLLVQWSMTALIGHGCRVMEGDFTFDWTGGGMFLE